MLAITTIADEHPITIAIAAWETCSASNISGKEPMGRFIATSMQSVAVTKSAKMTLTFMKTVFGKQAEQWLKIWRFVGKVYTKQPESPARSRKTRLSGSRNFAALSLIRGIHSGRMSLREI
jgi:hypothetical protein